MLSEALLAVTLVSGLPAEAVPIRVGNAQVDRLDLSVTYEFVNEAADVTAYEVSITRYFADGSTLVSTQGQDWFSSIGYTAVRAALSTCIIGKYRWLHAPATKLAYGARPSCDPATVVTSQIVADRTHTRQSNW
jgi:hypothetical protein